MIRVEGLGKNYIIGHQAERERYVALRDVLSGAFQRGWRRAADAMRGRAIVSGSQREEFWALKDIDFEVKRGEVLGVIGRNGAGKSTLLKILSRITEPSEGRVIIKGRIASLLEVGTGFHPELTGRENIFLNGALLGMTRREIRKKFDEIVAFSEVEKFLDTPVKHFSSGMYVRLAFAVAANLEAEILLVDEVLAVGDAEFQKKCIGKMNEVARENRTVLFVSHDMGAVRLLTDRCILLDRGKLTKSGNTEETIASYFQRAAETKALAKSSRDLDFFRRSQTDNEAPAIISKIDLKRSDNTVGVPSTIGVGDRFVISLCLDVLKTINSADVGMVIRTSQGQPITAFAYSDKHEPLVLRPGKQTIEVAINDLPLVPGEYFLDVGIEPIVGGASCDALFAYPLLSVVNQGQITRWLNRPGMVHCQDVHWDILGILPSFVT